jgi:hypothetical protein
MYTIIYIYRYCSILCIAGIIWSIYYIYKINKDIETEKNNMKKDILKTINFFIVYYIIL